MTNIRRIEKLQRSGAMTEAGLIKVKNAMDSGEWQAAIDREQPRALPADLESMLRRRKGALAAYRELPDSKKKQYLYWIQSARREDTWRRRIVEMVNRILADE